MTLDRRAFIELGLATGAGLLLRPPPVWALAQAAPLTKPIPSSGERVPVIGLGSAGTFDLSRDSSDWAPAREVVRLFEELGGKVIDTSPTYRRSEDFLGRTLQDLGIEDDVFVATKVNVGGAGVEAALAQMEASSRTFGREVIDLMQVWNLGDAIRRLTDRYLPEHMEAVAEWKRRGRIRYVGITTSRDQQYEDFEEAMLRYPLDFVQLDYSIWDRVPEQRLLPLAEEKGIAVIVNRPFATGSIFRLVRGKPLPEWASEIDCESWAQFFLKFVVSHPAVTCAVPATSDPEHLRDNMGAGRGRLPDGAMRRRMAEHFREV